MLIFGFFGAVLFNFIFVDQINFMLIFIAAITATIFEALSPKDFDNLLIPVAIGVVYLIYY